MNKTYLIFENWEMVIVSLINAPSLTEAVRTYIAQCTEEEIVMQPDGSITVDHQKYAHPLAFIEAGSKTEGEWQIRAIPHEFGLRYTATEFWGDDSRYPAEMIDACRPVFRQSHPRSRAKAFAWDLTQGTLVTFYRKTKPWQITILGRYLWSWASGSLTVEKWHGDYQTLASSLALKSFKPFPPLP